MASEQQPRAPSPTRLEGGRWAPGASANPSGRRADGQLPSTAWEAGESANPKGLPASVREVRELAAKHGPEMVERLLGLARQTERPDLALAAACALLDRMGARPFAFEPERLEVLADGPLAEIVLAKLTAIRVSGGAGGAGALPAAGRDGSPGQGSGSTPALEAAAGPANGSAE